MRDIGIREGEEKSDLFKEVMSGSRVLGWNEQGKEDGTLGEIYPWAQCYGGEQPGSDAPGPIS